MSHEPAVAVADRPGFDAARRFHRLADFDVVLPRFVEFLMMPHPPVRTHADIVASVRPWRYAPLEIVGIFGISAGLVFVWTRPGPGVAAFLTGLFSEILMEKLNDRRIRRLRGLL